MAMAPWGMVQAQPVPTVRIARIQGSNLLPTHLMQRRRRVEQHAARLGLPDARVEWINLVGGANVTDALLAGSVDVVSVGPGNMFLL